VLPSVVITELEYTPPLTVAPSPKLMLEPERMVPSNVVPAPRVDEEPAAYQMSSAVAPSSKIMLTPVDATSSPPVTKTKVPLPLNVMFPVMLSSPLAVYTPGVKTAPPRRVGLTTVPVNAWSVLKTASASALA